MLHRFVDTRENHRDQVVEIMCDAARQASDGFKPLRSLEL
jgi:hypothetical protein